MDALIPYLLVVIIFLGSPAYRTLVAAFNYLSRLDSVPIRLLIQAESHSDKEIASRAKLIVDRWFCKNAEKIVKELKPKGWDDYPWICTKNWDGRWSYGIDNGYLEQLKEERFQDSPPKYPMWSEATRRYLTDLIRQRKDTTEIIDGFCEMQRRWCKENGHPIHRIDL